MAACARVEAVATALRYLGGRGLLPAAAQNWTAINRPVPATAPVTPLWRDAITALEADPDAVLPGELTPPPAAA